MVRAQLLRSLGYGSCFPAIIPPQRNPPRFILSNRAPGKVRGVSAAQSPRLGDAGAETGMAEPPRCHPLVEGWVGAALMSAALRLAAKQRPPCFCFAHRPDGGRT